MEARAGRKIGRSNSRRASGGASGRNYERDRIQARDLCRQSRPAFCRDRSRRHGDRHRGSLSGLSRLAARQGGTAHRHRIPARHDGRLGPEFSRAARDGRLHRAGRPRQRALSRRRREDRVLARFAAAAPARQNLQCRTEFPRARQRDAARRHDARRRPAIHWREIDLAALSLFEGAQRSRRRV